MLKVTRWLLLGIATDLYVHWWAGYVFVDTLRLLPIITHPELRRILIIGNTVFALIPAVGFWIFILILNSNETSSRSHC